MWHITIKMSPGVVFRQFFLYISALAEFYQNAQVTILPTLQWADLFFAPGSIYSFTCVGIPSDPYDALASPHNNHKRETIGDDGGCGDSGCGGSVHGGSGDDDDSDDGSCGGGDCGGGDSSSHSGGGGGNGNSNECGDNGGDGGGGDCDGSDGGGNDSNGDGDSGDDGDDDGRGGVNVGGNDDDDGGGGGGGGGDGESGKTMVVTAMAGVTH